MQSSVSQSFTHTEVSETITLNKRNEHIKNHETPQKIPKKQTQQKILYKIIPQTYKPNKTLMFPKIKVPLFPHEQNVIIYHPLTFNLGSCSCPKARLYFSSFSL